MNAAFLRLWGWPIVLAALTCSGLASALFSDGWGDLWSWLALGVTVATGAWYAIPRRARPTSTHSE